MKMNLLGKITTTVAICTMSVFILGNSCAKAKPGDAYSAEKAVAYADSCFKKKGSSYKKNPNKKYGEELCAGYVSQCLKEGGMTMDSTWKWTKKGKSTLAWRVSTLLFSYLKKSGYKVTYSPRASQVKKGDVIFYWTNGGWGHVSICVGKTKSGKPMVNAYNDPKYHFSYWTMGYKTCLISMESKTATPEISQTTVNDGKKISISCDTPKATIYYTTNGKTPTKSSKKYTGAFTLNANAKVKAMAIYPSYKKSSTATQTVDIQKTIDDGIYYLKTSANKVSLGINNSSKLEKATLSLLQPTAEYNRKFSVKYIGDGNYTLTLLHSGYALSEEVYPTDSQNELSSKTTAYTQISGSVIQAKYASNALQQWKIKYLKTGAYQITNNQTSDYLSVGVTNTTGTVAYTTNAQETSGQVWNLQKTSLTKLKLKEAAIPSKLKAGNSLSLKGTIKSNYKILSVSVNLIDSNGKIVSKAYAVPNNKKYLLKKLKSKIKCKNLAKGTYRLRITAFDSSKQIKTLWNKKLKIK